MEGRALGKGLSALIPEKAKSNVQDSVATIKINEIRENSLQPRSHYDDAKQSELMASIKDKGVLQPILVRPKNGHFEVVAGERRFRAARGLNLEEIPAVIKDVSDQEALVLALVENIQREELNPIEEAKAYKKLIEEFNLSQDLVAQSVGKDRSTISNVLRLLKLPEDIQKYVSEGELSMGHARALVSLDNAALQRELCQHVVKKELSVRELENLINQGFKSSSPRKKAKISNNSRDAAELEDQLQKVLGTKVRVQAQKKRGKIIIEYYSLDELKRILDFFKK